MSIHEPGII